jgi:hypothetical protein
MTLGEIERAIKSKIRVKQATAKEQATFDYILANLITMGVGCALDSSAEFPTIEDAYPSLFSENKISRAEEKQAKLTELSILRFKQYANFHNRKIEEVGKLNE